MKTQGYRIALYFLILSFALATPSQAIRKTRPGRKASGVGFDQGLAGMSRVEVGFGWRHHPNSFDSEWGWNAGDFNAATEGTFGHIALSHFDNDNLAYMLKYTIHDVETDSWYDSYGDNIEETRLVHSVMFGMRFYLPQSRSYSAMRPYFSAAAGPVIGTVNYRVNDYCDCEEYSETDHTTVMGARLGGGIDLRMGRSFMVGMDAGYNFFGDFDEPIAGRRDYSGSEFGVNFSWLFGR